MPVPVLTFFNNARGVGKTALAYHLAVMLSRGGVRVLVCDWDPQARLTAAFLGESVLEGLWTWAAPDRIVTVFRAIQPLFSGGELAAPLVRSLMPDLGILPGDPALAVLEEPLQQRWLRSGAVGSSAEALRSVAGLWQAAQAGAEAMEADLVLADVGPGFNALNRCALCSSDFIVIPVTAELFSLQALRHLGPPVREWRESWKRLRAECDAPAADLPSGAMEVIGYLFQEHAVGPQRASGACRRWAEQLPEAYRTSILGESPAEGLPLPFDDPFCLAVLKPFLSLTSMAEEARKPIFDLTLADGAMGGHAQVVQMADRDFRAVAATIRARIGV